MSESCDSAQPMLSRSAPTSPLPPPPRSTLPIALPTIGAVLKGLLSSVELQEPTFKEVVVAYRPASGAGAALAHCTAACSIAFHCGLSMRVSVFSQALGAVRGFNTRHDAPSLHRARAGLLVAASTLLPHRTSSNWTVPPVSPQASAPRPSRSSASATFRWPTLTW